MAGLIRGFFGLFSEKIVQQLLDATPEGAAVPPYSLPPDLPVVCGHGGSKLALRFAI